MSARRTMTLPMNRIAAHDPDDPFADAACRGEDPDLWYAEGRWSEDRAHLAKQLCSECPMRADCLALVMRLEGNGSRHLRYGIWAGTTPAERARMNRAAHENGDA